MLSSIFSVRGYLFIGVGVALVTFLITMFFDAEIASWARGLRLDAALAGQAGLGRFVANPMIYVAENGVIGAALAGLLWPFLLFWAIFIIFTLLVIVGSDTTSNVSSIVISLLV